MDLEPRVHKEAEKLSKEADLHKPIIVGAGAVIGGLLTGGIGGAVAGAVGGYVLGEAADHKSYQS